MKNLKQLKRVNNMKPYDRGVLDFRRGNIDNPFNNGTVRYREWQRGFNSAYFKQQDKFSYPRKDAA